MEKDDETYEDQVVKAAIQGLTEGGTLAPTSFAALLRLVYKAGYTEALRNQKGFSGIMD